MLLKEPHGQANATMLRRNQNEGPKQKENEADVSKEKDIAEKEERAKEKEVKR